MKRSYMPHTILVYNWFKYRYVGEQNNGGYLIRRQPFSSYIKRWLWRWRYRQAVKLLEMQGQAIVLGEIWQHVNNRKWPVYQMYKLANSQRADLIVDLIEVMEQLRQRKQYQESDQLRAIIGRIARAYEIEEWQPLPKQKLFRRVRGWK